MRHLPSYSHVTRSDGALAKVLVSQQVMFSRSALFPFCQESKMKITVCFFQTRQPSQTAQENLHCPTYLSFSLSLSLSLLSHPAAFFRCADRHRSLHTCLSPAQLQTHFHDISLSLSSNVLLARRRRGGIV